MAVLFIINFFVILLLILFVRRVNRLKAEMAVSPSASQALEDEKRAMAASREVLEMLEPLVEESRMTAVRFEDQITEKRKISKDLNEKLDARIISINLLLNRAAKALTQLEEQQERIRRTSSMVGVTPPSNPSGFNVLDQQNRIIDLYYQQEKVDDIATKLSIPRREVQLVIDLKEKFVAMEQGK
ncbi:MAG: hypothetical protein MI747_00330 [Desulfobacterales bacterium]|nr:hypothetical protein [Desulfobacterales bacterium]